MVGAISGTAWDSPRGTIVKAIFARQGHWRRDFWYNTISMKCELCHQKDAETAIQLEKDGEEQELYVCRECANRERVRRQKKSQRTRKGVDGLPPGVSISVSGVSSGDEPPPPS